MWYRTAVKQLGLEGSLKDHLHVLRFFFLYHHPPSVFPKTSFLIMLSDQMDLCFLEAGKPDCMAHRRQMLPLALDAHSLYSLLRVPGHWEVVLSAGSSLCLLSSISEPTSHRLCGVLSARAQQPEITPDPKYTALLLLANCATGNLLPGPVNLCFPLGGWGSIRPQWKEESGLRCCTGTGCMVVTNSMSLFHSFKQMVS